MNDKQKDLVFIISGGRTGTKFLGDRLSQAIPESFSVHEPDTFSLTSKHVFSRIWTFGLWHMTLGRITGKRGIRSIGQKLLSGKLERDTALRRLLASREFYFSSISKPLIIESNNQWAYACDEFETLWPKARIAVIVRDPRTWIRSWLNKGTRWRPYDLARLVPPGRLTPAKVKDTEWSRQWRSFDTFGRLAWEWKFVYTRLLDHVESNSNARLFRFEDLFQTNNATAMRELVEFASTHTDRQYQHETPEGFTDNVHNASKGSATDWQEWEPRQARLVDRLCGPLMEKLGYGNEPEWKSKLKCSIG